MSTRYNNGSHYENHQRAAELHDIAAHAHRVAEHQGKEDHLTGVENTRQAFEHSQEAYRHTRAMAAHGIETFGHDDIAALAYAKWQAKGCPEGTEQEDWQDAVEALRSHSHTE